MVKIVYLKFANRKLNVNDYLIELSYAVEHARIGLKRKHKIDIALDTFNDQVFVWVETCNDKPLNYGNCLRGISKYLIEHGGYHNGEAVDFSKYRVGNRLLEYYPVSVKPVSIGN